MRSLASRGAQRQYGRSRRAAAKRAVNPRCAKCSACHAGDRAGAAGSRLRRPRIGSSADVQSVRRARRGDEILLAHRACRRQRCADGDDAGTDDPQARIASSRAVPDILSRCRIGLKVRFTYAQATIAANRRAGTRARVVGARLARLESLCIACGLGLILFDSQNASHPNFSIRVRAMRTEPDMFYVNRNLKLIEQRIFD